MFNSLKNRFSSGFLMALPFTLVWNLFSTWLISIAPFVVGVIVYHCYMEVNKFISGRDGGTATTAAASKRSPCSSSSSFGQSLWKIISPAVQRFRKWISLATTIASVLCLTLCVYMICKFTNDSVMMSYVIPGVSTAVIYPLSMYIKKKMDTVVNNVFPKVTIKRDVQLVFSILSYTKQMKTLKQNGNNWQMVASNKDARMPRFYGGMGGGMPETKDTEYEVNLAEGSYEVFYERHSCFLTVSYEEKDSTYGPTFEITVTCFDWHGSVEAISDFIQDAISWDRNSRRHNVSMYDFSPLDAQMYKVREAPKRKMGTLALRNRIGEKMIADAREFLASETRCADLGIPHRCGFLFQGDCGTGKTSAAHALASELNLDILNIRAEELADMHSRRSFVLPRKCVIVVEDLDSAFDERPRRKGMKKSKSTRVKKIKKEIIRESKIKTASPRRKSKSRRDDEDDYSSSSSSDSGVSERIREEDEEVDRMWLASNSKIASSITNFLDGLSTQNGSIIVMITNFRDNIPPSVLRAGRVTHTYTFSLCDNAQTEAIFRKFYPDATDEVVREFVALIPENKHAPSTVETVLRRHRDFEHVLVDIRDNGLPESVKTHTKEKNVSPSSSNMGPQLPMGMGMGGFSSFRMGGQYAAQAPPPPRAMFAGGGDTACFGFGTGQAENDDDDSFTSSCSTSSSDVEGDKKKVKKHRKREKSSKARRPPTPVSFSMQQQQHSFPFPMMAAMEPQQQGQVSFGGANGPSAAEFGFGKRCDGEFFEHDQPEERSSSSSCAKEYQILDTINNNEVAPKGEKEDDQNQE